MMGENKWNKDKVYRTTKCLSPRNNGYVGGFPIGFLNWIKKMGWYGDKRCYLCAGLVKDDNSVRVDIKPEVNPTLCEDATNTSLESNSFDWVMIDPPYTKDLARSLYGTEKHFVGINKFTKEGVRICKEGGLIISLSYEIPNRPKSCDLIACVGVYQTMGVSHMRCLAVWKKLKND